MTQAIEGSIVDIRAAINTIHEEATRSILPNSVGAVAHVVEEWEARYPGVATWKALCRKQGKHRAKIGGIMVHINWIDDLANCLINGLSKNFEDLIKLRIPTIKEHFQDHVQKCEEKLMGQLEENCLGVTSHLSNPLLSFQDRREAAEDEFHQAIVFEYHRTKSIINLAERKVTESIQEIMMGAYDAGIGAKGKPRLLLLVTHLN
jgi:hypothetical protein